MSYHNPALSVSLAFWYFLQSRPQEYYCGVDTVHFRPQSVCHWLFQIVGDGETSHGKISLGLYKQNSYLDLKHGTNKSHKMQQPWKSVNFYGHGCNVGVFFMC